MKCFVNFFLVFGCLVVFFSFCLLLFLIIVVWCGGILVRYYCMIDIRVGFGGVGGCGFLFFGRSLCCFLRGRWWVDFVGWSLWLVRLVGV